MDVPSRLGGLIQLTTYPPNRQRIEGLGPCVLHLPAPPAPQPVDRPIAGDPQQPGHECSAFVTQPADAVPGGREHLEDYFFGLVRIGQHGLGQTEEPGTRDLDQLDQRLLVAGDEPLAERALGVQRERLSAGSPFLGRTGSFSRLGL